MEQGWISQCERPPRDEKWIGGCIEVERIVLEGNLVENWIWPQLSFDWRFDWSTVSIQGVRTAVNEALDMLSRKSRSRIRIERVNRTESVG